MGERGCVLFAGGGAALWRLRRQSPPCGRRGGSSAAAAPRVSYTAFARCSAPQATVFRLPVRARPRPETGVCHRAGQKRIREFGAHCVPQGMPAGIPRRVPAAKPPERAPPCIVYGLGCGSGGLRLQIKKPPTGASYASIATGSAWVRNAMHPPK